MTPEETGRLLRELGAGEERNFSLLGFVRGNPVQSVERVGRSVLVRGRSDREWVYVASADPGELALLAERLTEADEHFAAVEPWMVPVLSRGRDIAWRLPMVRFTLPDRVALPEPGGPTSALVPEDAATVVEHSDYAQYISRDYARSRILLGPSAAVREGDELVAWGMTQDDGALGFLHVLDRCRHRGYGRRVVIALAAELRNRGLHPFAYVSGTNRPAIALVSRLGFERGGPVEWFRLRGAGTR